MDAARLQNRIAWGNNLTARRIGTLADAFRPAGVSDPLSLRRRYLRLHAAFSASPGNFGPAEGYGNAVYYGYFDSIYTRPGDYLVQPERTFFIASQESLLPVVCVRTNRTISVSRPALPGSAGAGGYGGLIVGDATPVLDRWPASVLGMATGGNPTAGLPTDTALPQWTVLLPSWEGIVLGPADIVTDGHGFHGTVLTAEQTGLGWRLIVRQVST